MMRRPGLSRLGRWIAVGVLAAVLVVAVLTTRSRHHDALSAADPALGESTSALLASLDRSLQRRGRGSQPAIAVRPFVVNDADDELTAMSSSLCESITSALARIPQLRITTCESARVALASSLDNTGLAKVLAVDHVIDGRLERAGEQHWQLRVVLYGGEPISERRQWVDRYDARSIQSVAATVARGLADSLGRHWSPAPADPIVDAASYAQFVRALQMSRRASVGSMGQALALVGQVLERTPDYLPAQLLQISLAETLDRFPGRDGTMPGVGQILERRAARAARKSALAHAILQRDSADANGHMLLADVAVFERRWVDAFDSLYTALSLPSHTAVVLRQAAYYHAMAGYLEQARDLATQAARLQPLDGNAHDTLALFHGSLGDTARMRDSAEIAIALGSNYSRAYLGLAALRAGDSSVAVRELTAAALSSNIDASWVETFVRAATGTAEPEPASRLLDDLPAGVRQSMGNFLFFHGWLGDTRRAQRILLNTVQVPPSIGINVIWWPELSHLRRESAFVDSVGLLGLPALWRMRGPPDRCQPAPDGSWTCQ